MDGAGNESAGFADPLSNFYLVAHRNDIGFVRYRCVHRHGMTTQLRRHNDGFIGHFRGLHVVGMNAAKESFSHCSHPHSLLTGWRLCHRILF